MDIQFLTCPKSARNGDGDFLFDGAVGKGVLSGDFRLVPNEGPTEAMAKYTCCSLAQLFETRWPTMVRSSTGSSGS